MPRRGISAVGSARALGIVLIVGALFLPWVRIPNAIPPVDPATHLEQLLRGEGYQRLTGLELPVRVIRAASSAHGRIGLAALEAASGAFDRAFARAVHGEGGDEKLVLLAWAPALLALLQAVFWRRLRGRKAAAALLVANGAVLLGLLLAVRWCRDHGVFDAPVVELSSGFLLTVLGASLLVLGSGAAAFERR